jgi:hypothetical protein
MKQKWSVPGPRKIVIFHPGLSRLNCCNGRLGALDVAIYVLK